MSDIKPIEPGNVDLSRRPRVRNKDGSESTVLSGSYDFGDGLETLLPHVSDDGKILDSRGAIELYRRTGKHLGKYRNVADADAAAKEIHEQQERGLRDKDVASRIMDAIDEGDRKR